VTCLPQWNINGAMRNQASRRNVTFELPLTEYKALQNDAAVRGLDSIHQRGREIVIDYLSHQATEDFSERIASIEQDIAHLGELVRRTAFSVIRHAAGRNSEEANEWIRENMPRITRG
jgi:hypothetical protein